MTGDLDFYFDFSSPYGYFAAMRIEALAARYQRTVNWHPILLGVVFKSNGCQPLSMVPMKGEYSLYDFARTARFHEIPYQQPSTFPLSTQLAARAMLWLENNGEHAKAAAFAKAVYHAYFADDIDISQAANLRQIAAQIDLDGEALIAAGNDAAIKEQLRTAIEQAMQRNVFGSPFIIVDDEPFWGFDRFAQLEAFLQEGKPKQDATQESKQAGPRKGYKALIDEAATQIKTYSVTEAQARLNDPNVQFVDIRDIRELEREGVIPGAFHAPRGMIEFWIDPESPYFKPIFGEKKEFIFFCAAGWRSALTAKTVQDMGLQPVADIEGGFGAWKAAGAPIAEKAKKA